MSLVEVKHQGHAQGMIQRAMAAGRLPHAYLFHGPDGVGKEMLARRLAQRLLCSQPGKIKVTPSEREAVDLDRLSDGCGRCEDCRAVQAGTHPDLHLIHRHLNRDHPDPVIRKRKGLDISIEVVRYFLIDKAGLTSLRGRAKVFVVREADRITPPAQNALLKTLEEPPPDTYLVLLVESLDRMLPTTVSRCQAVRFDPLPAQFVMDRLGELAPNLPKSQVRWHAGISAGSLGAALEQIEEGLFELNERLIQDLARFLAKDDALTSQGLLDEAKALGALYRKRDPDISDTEAARRAVRTMLKLIACWYADIVRVAGGRKEDVINTSSGSVVAKAAAQIGAEPAANAVQRIAQAERQLAQNVNTQLLLDALLIDLARLARKETVHVS
jgi:DNA polymerase-3 subunit delta'